MAKTENIEETKSAPKKETEELFDWYEPIDKEHKDPIWISINGKTTMIQRGKNLRVTRPVYEVLQNRRRMMQESLERSEELQKNSRF